MAKRSRYQQLDDAIQAMLARPETSLVEADGALTPLLRVAAGLRDLPRASFKNKLRSELEAIMSASTAIAEVSPIPKGYHTITPYIVVEKGPELVEFVKQVFGGEEIFRSTGSAGGMHCEVRVGDSMLMIGGGGAYSGPVHPTAIHLYVEDADAVYQRAVGAGATTLHPPVDQPYGDREASIRDAFGNEWYIATHKRGSGHIPAGLRNLNVFLHAQGAPQMIDFLASAFGAAEEARHQSPDGVVQHAVVRIGDSVLEMGEAHGQYQPMPTMFYLYVDDCDAWYRRAVAAGAASMSEPKDQPYGDRNAWVRDPFGNDWYLATHVKDVQP
jgi:uncharacterized glyoxalase superfamily protein PhnB